MTPKPKTPPARVRKKQLGRLLRRKQGSQIRKFEVTMEGYEKMRNRPIIASRDLNPTKDSKVTLVDRRIENKGIKARGTSAGDSSLDWFPGDLPVKKKKTKK